MAVLGDLIGAFLLIWGTMFCVLGVYGLLRLPDIYNRLHAVGQILTFGAGGVLLSLLFLAPPPAGLKALATALFLILTGPVVTHTLARAAYRLRARLRPEPVCDDLADDLRTGRLRRRRTARPTIEGPPGAG